jgi:hypothetical protein
MSHAKKKEEKPALGLLIPFPLSKKAAAKKVVDEMVEETKEKMSRAKQVLAESDLDLEDLTWEDEFGGPPR